jgi:hypothetical protein
MPVNLRCDCGHELTLQDDEAQELTWCPRCRKVLVQPQGLTTQRPLTRGRVAPAGGGGGNAAGARIAVGVLLFLVMGIGRGACTSHNTYEPPPRFDVRDFEVPRVPEAQPDWPRGPGFPPQPDERGRIPLLPQDRDGPPGGDQRDDRPDDP